MNRWKASGIHLLFSVLVVGAIAAWVLTVWYPPALLPMSGILGLILLIAGVDVVLGPTLTCVVYTPGKPSLKFDLTVIVLLQVAMLGYGLYVLAQNRPVFLVASVDRMNLVSAQEIADEDLAQAPPQWRHLSWTGPIRVGTELPADPTERQQLMMDSLNGRDIHVRPAYYTQLESAWPAMLEKAKPLPDLVARLDEKDRGRVARAAQTQDHQGWRYLPVVSANYRAATLLIDAQGHAGKFVAIDPWEATSAPSTE